MADAGFPDDAEWREQIRAFAMTRDAQAFAIEIEDFAGRLEADATANYALADAIERHGGTIDALTPRQLKDLRRRYADVLATTIGAHHTLNVPFVNRLLDAVERTLPTDRRNSPTELRACAAALAAGADNLRDLAGIGAELAEWIRVGEGTDGGKLPSVAMFYLMEWAERRHVGGAEISRRLVAAGVAPSGGASDEPDPAVRWEAILKSARSRYRRRTRAR